jgi:hypothetical protein
MEAIGQYNLRQVIKDDELTPIIYEPGLIGEIGEKRFLKPNLKRQFFTLTEVLGIDDNPEVYKTITESVTSLSTILKDDCPAIFTNRNSLKKLLTIISFDPIVPGEDYYIADTVFKITITRRGNNTIFSREGHPDNMSVGVDFENKATTSSKEYHQILSCSLNGMQLFLKYEVDCLDPDSMEVVELKTVKVKPKKQFREQITTADRYDPHKFYPIQKEKYRSYWVQMTICNVKRIILGKVFQNTVVAYEEFDDKRLIEKAWGGDFKSPQVMITRLGKLLLWIYDHVVEGEEYELTFNGSRNKNQVLLSRVVKLEATKNVDELADSLSSLKLGR